MASSLSLIAVLLLGLGAGLVWLAFRTRRTTGLAWVPIVASDTGTRHVLQRPLTDWDVGLTGKPDYILQHGSTYIPVEVKPTRRAAQPYDSDLMQLAAYCLLVETHYRVRPPYGILRYAEQSFRLDYTAAVEELVLELVAEMQDSLDPNVECERSHNEPARCRGCGFVAVCDAALVDAP